MAFSRWIPVSIFFRLLPVLLLSVCSVNADHTPQHAKFEWGVGMVAFTTPDYRGASQHDNYLLPFPYLKYRGERLRVDDGIEGRLFKSPDLLLSISGNGSFPSSNDNPEREGMDELDATVEFGPSLEYRLLHTPTNSIWLELPLRFAFSIGDEIGDIGKVLHPRLAWRRPALGKEDWKLRLAGGPLFADEDNHSYYYGVEEHESTANRPVYNAKSGYSGFRIDFSYSRRIDNLWLGGFIRHDDIRNSVFEDSPLVTTSSNWMAGIGIAWIISEI